MESLKIAKHDHYYHTHDDFFNHPFDFVHAFLMKDYDIGMHEQEFYEINVITDGSGVHYINNSLVPAHKGDVFIIPPNISHGYVGGKGFDVLHVILSDDFMHKYIADMQQLPYFFTLFGAEPLMRGKSSTPLHLSLSENELNDALFILMEIARYDQFTNPADCLIRNNLAMVSIGLLCNAYTANIQKPNSPYNEDKALMDSITHIHERYFEKITIDDLTRIAHLSRTSYIKKFKEICKMTPSAYITKVRIDSATAMLSNTALPISEIAYRTGFYDTSHFIKTFENHYGITPIEYRRK
jgi:AraC family L-rhamnose operon transcriptional activator RhaR/AraC family L-rhamnose operon regulatory protein RhaS